MEHAFLQQVVLLMACLSFRLSVLMGNIMLITDSLTKILLVTMITEIVIGSPQSHITILFPSKIAIDFMSAMSSSLVDWYLR